MSRSTVSVIALALAAGLIAAGCDDDNGGSSNAATGNTTTAAEAISKEEFAAKANQICKQGNQEIEQAGSQLGRSVNESQLEDFASNTLVPNVQSQIDGVRALGAPEGQEQQVTQFLDTAQADLDQLKADPSKIKDDHLFDDSDKQAKALGLTECGSG